MQRFTTKTHIAEVASLDRETSQVNIYKNINGARGAWVASFPCWSGTADETAMTALSELKND